MRVYVFSLALLIAGATAALAQTDKAHPAPVTAKSTFMQHEVCMMLPGIFSAYSMDERLASCTAVIESDKYQGKDLAEVYYNRSVFYLKKGDDNAALADIETSHKLYPDFDRPLINRATIHLRRHEYDLALYDLNYLVEMNPNSYASLTDRASVYFEMGKYDLALKDIDSALAVNRRGNSAMLLRGEIALAYGDFDNALKDGALAIEYDPDNPSSYNIDCFAHALAKREMETTGLSDCNKSLELRPGNEHALDSRGFLYLQLGRYADAIADLSAAIAKDPTMGDALYGRGLAKQKLGDSAGAAADMAAGEALLPGVSQKFGTPGMFTLQSAHTK